MLFKQNRDFKIAINVGQKNHYLFKQHFCPIFTFFEESEEQSKHKLVQCHHFYFFKCQIKLKSFGRSVRNLIFYTLNILKLYLNKNYKFLSQ